MKRIIIALCIAFAACSVSAGAAELTAPSAQIFKQSKKAKAEIKEVTFTAHIHCASCVKKLQENISYEKGVKGLHICMEDQIINIKYDSSKTNEETLKAAIEKLGVEVTGKREHGHQHNH